LLKKNSYPCPILAGMTTIPIRVARTILDEIEAVYDDVAKRAYEKFLDRGRTCTLDIEDWLEAEHELLLKPSARLIEKNGHLVVRLQIEGVDPKNLSILLTPDDAIVQSVESYPRQRIFRTVHFPFRIDTAGARACWVRGRVILVVLRAVSGVCEAAPGQESSEALHTAHI
jgi:hypothetical protein